MEYAKEDPGINKLKGLDEGAGGLIVVNGIHLCDKNMRILFHIGYIIFVSPAL